MKIFTLLFPLVLLYNAHAAPLVIDHQSNLWLANLKVSNPDGPCITILNGAKNIQIINSEIGPCAGAGITIVGSAKITVSNSNIHDTAGNAIQIATSAGVTIQQNRVSGGMSSVYAYASTGVQINKNSFFYPQN